MAARVKTPKAEDDLYLGLGGRLSEMRQALGLSYRALGELAGVSHQTIYSVEKNMFSAGVGMVEKLARALSVSPAWLAYGIGPEVPEEVQAAKKKDRPKEVLRMVCRSFRLQQTCL